jgi:hypothetical protein
VKTGSKISVAKGGKITGSASAITFGDSGAAIGVGILEATPASATTSSEIVATSDTDTTITGVFTLTGTTSNANILISKANRPLIITGTVNVGAQTSYDVFTLTGGTLNGVSNVGFDATGPFVNLATSGTGTLTGGTITTEGTGILKIGTNFTLKAPVAQTIDTAVLNGSGALTSGTLALAGSSVLSIITGGDFTVGNGPTDVPATLSVSGDASIFLGNGRGIVLKSIANKIGSLTLGSLVISGDTAGTISSFITSAASITEGPYPTTDGTGLGQIYGAFGSFAGAITTTVTAQAAAALAPSSTDAKITGGASGNTLTANTKLYTSSNS